MTVARPVMRYHGGKWRLAQWIISHFPAHKVYVEPFGGAASVLMQKPRSYAEVYNDLAGDIVNVFCVLRDPLQAAQIETQLRLTPFARDEFDKTTAREMECVEDPLERARRTIFRSMSGFGSASSNPKHATGFRANSNRSGTTPAHDWANYPDHIKSFTDRLRGVVIENRPAIEVMTQHDSPDTLHYIDPPYVFSTRRLDRAKGKGAYIHEMSDAQHCELLTHLRGLRGMVVLSGYRCPIYDDMLSDWRRVDRAAHADGARDRVESLWLSPNINLVQQSLYKEV
jgi:DNA adenine methylase